MRPLNVRIIRIKKEAKEIKTFFFDFKFKPQPGQYLMVWIRGVDEIPMSFSYDNAITFKKLSYTPRFKKEKEVMDAGMATTTLFKYREGNTLGIRGPYGRPFTLRGRKIAIIAGGMGSAPLAYLAEKASIKKMEITTFLGGKCKEELLFVDRFKKVSKVYIATEDGSIGMQGLVTDLLKWQKLENYDSIYACGPELMMSKILQICNSRDIAKKLQLSVRRYFRCGMGLCGSCDLGGFRVCVEGPVFDGPTLLKTEFGKWSRDRYGCRYPLLSKR